MPATSKTHGISPALYDYMLSHGTPPDAVQRDLIAETRRLLPDKAEMQIAPEQGAFMTMLTRLSRARLAVEVGTFTGFSALCIARGLPADGKLLCFEANPDWIAIARPFWQRAGVAERIEVRIGDAAERLRELPSDPAVDLAFIDADKPRYPLYYQELLARLAPYGVLLVDNVFGFGDVADPDVPSEGSLGAIRAFNDLVAADDRVEKVMVAIGDGLTLIQRR